MSALQFPAAVMSTFVSHSPEETLALGEQWGRAAQPGWLIGLTGELGAGKTQLVKGIARGLGVRERILSPTFALVHSYASGRLPLFHLDLYRLDTPAQVIGAGLEEYLYPRQGVTVVEWVERWLETPPGQRAPGPRASRRYRQVYLESANETGRRITYEDFSA